MKKSVSMDFAQSFGRRLSTLRKELSLHQSKVAEKMKVSERVYRRYEAGEQVPGTDKVNALVEDLQELNPEWLLTGDGRMFKSSGLKETILDIVAGNESIQRIVIMLKGLDDEDLQGILHQVMERKRLRDLHTELRDMVNKLERPVSGGAHEE
ncbi:helix-turn-helix domain-containing protein [Desulfoferrobacter suflitae]|uniref:helix-turn-helix domain-containing protein n=1 Tax=Desulfoferrobacter suflitae TaxID=2865782 RepID=UPI00216496DC|nr:helix-turn-helix transcriptional regulator [Desulfoferrobacter suflitae]MCK8604400.1 helix-turn-helix domain-containing protein [Desulfoferrobacter suflitae]